MKTDMIRYYAQRAVEYERIYDKPERQGDLRRLRKLCGSLFEGCAVLEVSCGTGYWTEAIASAAKLVLACDINDEVLEIAKTKDWVGSNVVFCRADSYSLPNFGRLYSAGFSGFWWSHIPKKKLSPFLAGFHAHLSKGAVVTFIDNRYVEGSSTPIFRTDTDGNSFQQRKLSHRPRWPGSLFVIRTNTQELWLQLRAYVDQGYSMVVPKR